MNALHWAAHYIGKPYQRGASGPHAYDCWGLMVAVFRDRFGAALPQFDLAEEGLPGLKTAATALGWSAASGGMQDGDLVLTRLPAGRHVALAVAANGRLGLLHAATGRGVVFEDRADVAWPTFDLWRARP